MPFRVLIVLGLLVGAAIAQSESVQAAVSSTEIGVFDTVHVAPPTGEMITDRTSILAALEQVRPGGTVQFAPGMYRVGELVPVTTARITMLGHPAGTVLRGCDPDEYDEMDRDAVRAFQSPDPQNPRAAWAVVSRCGMFEFSGGHVTVRNLTFEYSRLGLVLGCCDSGRPFRPTDGGYLIEANTFRNSGNSIRARLSSAEPTVIRYNSFINTFHALSARGSNLYFLDNDVSVPEPRDVPGGHPGFRCQHRLDPALAGARHAGRSLCGQHHRWQPHRRPPALEFSRETSPR